MSRIRSTIGLLTAICAAVIMSFIIPTTAHAANGNQLLARGTVTEQVPGGNWNIEFGIHARGNGNSSSITVRNPNETFTFRGSLCAGTYTDPNFGGTTVFVVGPQTSYTGNGASNRPYYGFKVHKVAPNSADFAWVNINITSLSQAQSVCADPATAMSASSFPVIAANVLWKVDP